MYTPGMVEAMDEVGGVALRVQRMSAPDTALVLAQLAADRRPDGAFAPKGLEEVYMQAGIPIPSKVSNQIASLRRLAYVREAGRAGAWKLTPLGRARVG